MATTANGQVFQAPYILGGNDLAREEGMAFSVEPEIYRAGRWGARIEDAMVVTGNAVHRCNERPHGLVRR